MGRGSKVTNWVPDAPMTLSMTVAGWKVAHALAKRWASSTTRNTDMAVIQNSATSIAVSVPTYALVLHGNVALHALLTGIAFHARHPFSMRIKLPFSPCGTDVRQPRHGRDHDRLKLVIKMPSGSPTATLDCIPKTVILINVSQEATFASDARFVLAT